MIDDKDLIRRALLGDQDAQKQCTEKGIALPCPFCGSENIVISNLGIMSCMVSSMFGEIR